ncbi:hypothetical protein QE369_003522 [Agrobacterium larrymoorei]|uniref:DUF2332 domain-containing protein n=1 Tax=Agrobacterium larrymoorei TaxID=160699 RepID=A0AAJ2BPM3_9HYPH|nr:DUF2332 family protein [Agrobacterium larrymoorei]MDR6103325.1 hypothetical protein [Agrobacterium larrymoorei]
MPEAIVRAAFLTQADACDGLGSPFTARLCRLLSEKLETTQGAVARTLLTWPGAPGPSDDSVPLRIAGALHALVLSERISPLTELPDNALSPAVQQAFQQHEAFILERLTSPPQTNEVRRSAALLPGLFIVAERTGKPLILSEVGASVGLNLQLDRYRYRLGEMEWGPESPVVLSPEWRGTAPSTPSSFTVLDRAGCDLNPLNPSSPDDRLRQLSYIWADQKDRLERTQNALSIAAENHLQVEKADAIDWLAKRLETPKTGATHIVFHSVAWQYFPDALKQKGEALIAEAGKRATPDAPLARLQMEGDGQPRGAALTLQMWPTGEKQEIGRADFHGRWVEWRGWVG